VIFCGCLEYYNLSVKLLYESKTFENECKDHLSFDDEENLEITSLMLHDVVISKIIQDIIC